MELFLDWTPRLQNEEAYALTNGDFSVFSPGRRVDIDPARLQFLVMPELMEVAESLHADIVNRRGTSRRTPAGGGSRSKKLKETDPWE